MQHKTKEDETEQQLNSGHYHEVMDRAAMLGNIWLREVQDLPATQRSNALKIHAEKVSLAIADFYQASGMIYHQICVEEI